MWNPSRQKLTRRWFLKGAVAAKVSGVAIVGFDELPMK